MTAACAVCGTPAPLIEHRYYEGDPRRPARRWTLVRALYYLGETNFCGARCALLWRQRN